jgi:hypothetical protein
MTLDTLNSILNAGANMLLCTGGLYFYYHHLSKKMGYHYYHLLRVATAMLISGALMRTLVDIDYVMVGKSPSYVWYEAAIGLLRNYGLGVILIYTVIKYKELKDIVCRT